MGESRIFCLGCGCLENLFLVFHTAQCGPGLPFEAIGPKRSYFFSGLSITVFLRKHITTCDFPGGSANPLPPPSGQAHAMIKLTIWTL